MNGLEILRARYPWPETMPDVPPDDHGWLVPDTAKAITDRLDRKTQLVVECGSWLGCSARAILCAAPAATLICIDTWNGSPEHWADTGVWKARLATLYGVFLRNQWPHRDRVIPLRADSLVGLGEVFACGLEPDLIYLDSKHSYGRVSAELAVCCELFPRSHVVLDDTNNAAVLKACLDHFATHSRPMQRLGSCAAAFAPYHEV